MKKIEKLKEEHIVLVQEPGSKYLGHITPESGKAEGITTALIEHFSEDVWDKISSIGSDGTNVNTGIHAGIIRRIEISLKRPLQWFICLLHFNELPLRALFLHLDGRTCGPSQFTGKIGKLLPKCESLPIVNFVPIQFALSKGMQFVLNVYQKVIVFNFQIKLNLFRDVRIYHKIKNICLTFVLQFQMGCVAITCLIGALVL